MSLLDTASLLLTPNAYKEGKLYSVIPSDGSGDFTFTRATTATRVNSDGLVELVPYNLLQRSEEFDNGAWTKSASSITANATTAPNGTLTADKLISTSVSSSHLIYQNLGSVGDTRVISCFVKKAEYRYVNLQYGTAYARFDFDTLTFLGGTSNTYTDEGNGWYRISTVLTATVNARATILIPDNSGNISYVGDDVSGTFIWGFQANEGTNALPYQKTETRLNIPRLDYSLGGCPNILLEPQRTNLALYSSSFDNAAWSKTGITVTPNQGIAPDGTLTMDLITFDSAARATTQGISVTSGATYTFSVWLATQSGTQTVEIGNINVSAFQSVTVTTTPQRFEVTQVASAATRYPGIKSTAAYSILAWGAQLEAGSYATSYIGPTTTASVTRNADVCLKTGISSLIGQTEGTLFGEFTYSRDDGGTRRLLSLTDGGTTNRITTYIDSNDKISIYIVDSSSVQVDIRGLVALVVGTTYKYAIAYKLNDVKLYVNGVEDGSDTSATIPSCSQLYVGSENGNNPSYFNWNQVLLFPTRLTDDQLAQLTTI